MSLLLLDSCWRKHVSQLSHYFLVCSSFQTSSKCIQSCADSPHTHLDSHLLPTWRCCISQERLIQPREAMSRSGSFLLCFPDRLPLEIFQMIVWISWNFQQHCLVVVTVLVGLDDPSHFWHHVKVALNWHSSSHKQIRSQHTWFGYIHQLILFSNSPSSS